MNLFAPVVPEEKWHPNFAAIVKTRNGFNCDVLNDWAKGFPDRDGKFVQEWQSTFNSCFWELYLNAALKDLGFVSSWIHPSPDFHVIDPIEFILEATIASNEDNGVPEFTRLNAAIPEDINEFNRKTIIRLSNSIHSKYKKYKAHYSSLPHVSNKPFIIAVASFDRPFFPMECQRSIEALLFEYYVDEENYLSGDKLEHIAGKQLGNISKDNGSPVELGIFTKESMPEVSAVIFNSTATWGKVRALSNDPNPNIEFTALRLNPNSHEPHVVKAKKHKYQETLLDGLRIYHNPYAQNPIDPRYFRRKEVFQWFMNFQTGEWEYEQHEGQLLFRSVFTQYPKGHLKAR
jgi:hypothetical protein